ncbi:hypothetical protein AAFC00_002931 [Neodothiora populina]|uniref:Inositol polyphosphate-related phosphatase domain-containing protein n=1 Tax=Neodothiora populina TaxID=2781224 RepID=A0ABR3P8Q8_9PEZI
MSDPKPRPSSTSSSLLQDVPGAFPTENNNTSAGETFQSLSQAVHARRERYVKPRSIRIKVGTWNCASFKGTENDIGGWFVKGQGVANSLTDLEAASQSEPHGEDIPEPNSLDERESVDMQESRYARKSTALPRDDPGSLPGGEEVDLYLLGLQEVVDINSATEALRPYTDPNVSTKFKKSLEEALPKGYTLVAEQQLIGMLLLAYASPDLAPDIKSVSTTSVGTGLMGYMGNKGAVTARLVLGETTRLVFINAHLAAGADKGSLERRNWDYSQVLSRTKFQPITDSMDLHQSIGETIGDEDFAFFVGDLNYRIKGIPGEDVRRLLMLHTRNEYDLSANAGKKIDAEIEKDSSKVARRRSMSTVSSASYSTKDDSDDDSDSGLSLDALNPENDPASLQTTLMSLLPHDELQQQIKKGKAFQDWQEGPITFLPTYKYDAGSVGVFDSSEKRRAPSWCDRILYRTRRDRLAYEGKLAEAEEVKKRDEELRNSGVEQAAKDEDLLYDYDPDEDAAGESTTYDEVAEADPGVVITREGFEDEIVLEYYTAHQRVLSSDHKPLTAVYTLKYDSVVPELKAKVVQEVARELDRVENEGRPSVTVVVDRHHGEEEKTDDDPAKFEGVTFGEVRYAMHKHRHLTIANTGRVPATMSFVDRPVGAGQSPGIAPVWLTLKSDNGNKISSATATRTLEPGETFTVDLELRILDVGLARAFNEGIKLLDDILVLRVEGGRDHFIPLRGTWLESSLGHSINKLIRIPEGGIRRLQRQRPDSSTSKDSSESSEPVKWSAPRELFRLTEAVEDLTVRSVAEWSMTSGDEQQAPWEKVAGWPFAEESWISTDPLERADRLAAVCEALDTDSPLEQGLPVTIAPLERLECLANFLLLFLTGFSDGVVTQAIWTQVDSGMQKAEKERKQFSEEEQRTWIQEVLSQQPAHSISFILICAMLDRIINEIASAHAAASSSAAAIANQATTTTTTTTTTAAAAAAQPAPALPPLYLRPAALVRWKATSKDPLVSHRETLVRAMSSIFAPIIIRSPVPVKDKEKAALDERKMKVMELFLAKS